MHHYDEIGLLTPNDRTSAGYRRYGDTDLQRLQESCSTASSGSASTASRATFVRTTVGVTPPSREDASRSVILQREVSIGTKIAPLALQDRGSCSPRCGLWSDRPRPADGWQPGEAIRVTEP
jgi:hypothetical protein